MKTILLVVPKHALSNTVRTGLHEGLSRFGFQSVILELPLHGSVQVFGLDNLTDLEIKDILTIIQGAEKGSRNEPQAN